MLHSQRLTNNIDVIFMTVHISVIQLPCQPSINTSKILKWTSKTTLLNCAERPIGEYMREKYTPFLATNSTTLLTLFKQLSMKHVWRHASPSFNGRSPHVADTNRERVHLRRSQERLSPLRQAILDYHSASGRCSNDTSLSTSLQDFADRSNTLHYTNNNNLLYYG